MNVRLIFISCAVALGAVACSSDPATPPADAGDTTDVGKTPDTGTPLDTGTPPTDTGTPPSDAGTPNDRVVATDATAPSDASRDAGGDAGPDPWACLGRVMPGTPAGAMSTITYVVQNFQTNMPMSGVTVKVCARTDLTCATPQSMGVTNAMGTVMLTAMLGASGFDGYFELTGGTGTDQVVPTRTFPVPAITASSQRFVNNAIPQLTFELLGGVLNARLDAMTGGITGLAADCNGRPAAGVAVSLAPAQASATRFYIAGSLPSTSAMATDATGLFGYVNVAPGDYTLTADRTSPMARVGTATLNVRGGFISLAANLGPSP